MGVHLKHPKKQKPRDLSKRNFQGPKLVKYMEKRARSIERLEPFKAGVNEMINRFRDLVMKAQEVPWDGDPEEKAKRKRQEKLEKLAIIANSNEELKQKRALKKALDDEIAVKEMEYRKEKKRLEREELKKSNTALVLQVIEESKDFISFDNMDEKIESVLSNTVNFNYAITPYGEKIHSTKPPGNLDGWKGPSPSAYAAGGVEMPGLKVGGLFPNANE